MIYKIIIIKYRHLRALEIFENLRIYIPGDWGFLEIWGFLFRGLGIFLPRIFAKSRGLGIFENMGILIPRIFAKSRGYLRNLRDFYPGDIFWGFLIPRIFWDGDFLEMGIFFRGMGYANKKSPLFLYEGFLEFFYRTNFVFSISWCSLIKSSNE